MSTIISLWSNANTHRRSWLVASAVAVVLAVLLIAAGEVGDWGWTRLVGAGVISLASVVFGILVGWSDPVRPLVREWLYGQRKLLAILLAAVIAAPLAAGMVIGLAGLFGDSDAGLGVVLLGLTLTVLLLVATAGAVWVGISQAIRGLDHVRSGENGHADGQDTP